mmetsp:Transcript_10598/g.15989  ORF Transcript_10598/g.15989 Transcript_10598/m.15989 type:complete len:266 (-) Transcript_10598:117-914(-)
MVGSFLSISMWSAISAFIGTMILIYSAIVVLRLRGVQIWGAPPPSPASVVAALSDEDKEKIEKLRSSAILRHLKKYTTTLNEGDMTRLTSTTEEESTTTCISTENSHSDQGDEEQPQVDIEEGTISDDKTEYSHICVPLPGQQSCVSNTNETDNTSETSSLNDIPDTRNVPNLCVICHEEYETSDKVCWASSSDCTHVFHEECIVRWLTSLGWMKLKEQKEPQKEDNCLNYDLECPMCRGTFICKDHLIENTPVVVAAGTGDESV